MKKIISILLIVAILIPAMVFNVSAAETITEAHSTTFYRGVNLSGPESAGHIIPGVEGTHYTFGEEKIFAYLERKGFDIARVPILWERIQPVLNGTLDANYLAGLKRNADWAEKHNMKIIIDVHNYGKYNGEYIGVEGSSVTTTHYADLWTKLSTEFKNHKGVYAYDIMNEPTFEDYKDWHTASQAAVDAIRANEDTKLIFVEGNFWAHCDNWTEINGEEPWITDSYSNTSYSAHCYFDTDTSGTYKLSYDDQLKETPDLLNIGAERLKDFGEWCKKYNLKGFIGEFGAPYRDDSKTGDYQSSTRWSQVIDNFLDAVDSYGMDATVWAAGHWWGTGNALNVYPQNQYMNPLSGDSVHMDILTSHLSNKEDTANVKFGNNRVYEAEYAVTDTGIRASSSKASNKKYVSMPASATLDFCRIKSDAEGSALLNITYMARQNAPNLTVQHNGKIIKETSLEKVTSFNDYITYIDLVKGENSIIISTDADSTFVDKITITPLKTELNNIISPINSDIIKLSYSSTKAASTVINISEAETIIALPSTNGRLADLSVKAEISAGDTISYDDSIITSIELVDSSITKDGKETLDLPVSIDRFKSAVIARNTADFNNNDDEIWGYKGYDGNMKNWDVQKHLHDDSTTDRYYKTSFDETGTYGTMKSAHMNLPLGQGNMWELSGFKYITMDIRSNTAVSIRLYQNGSNARETNAGMIVPSTNNEWTTISIPIEDFMSSWLYDDFTRNSSRTNYVIFYPAFTDGGSAHRYFDIDNISFNWTDKMVGITSLDFENENGSLNKIGLQEGNVKVTAKITNNKDMDNNGSDENVILLFALYDKITGNLLEVSVDKKTVKIGKTETFTATLNVPDNSLDRYETRTNLWTQDTQEPITEPYVF